MTLVYTTPAAYEGWSGGVAPDNITALLRAASLLVRSATRNDLYGVDTAGKPSDDAVASAFADATCEHALYWATNEIDPLGPTATQVVASSGIDGATVTYDAGSVQAAASDRVASLSRLCSSALVILRNAGLATAAV